MKPGERVGGRFVLDALAGKGAMGAVYRARDTTTGEVVAVKVLTGGPRAGERFLREIEVIARLHHPRIVRYVSHGFASDGAPFLAMEWLEGETLARRLERAPLGLVEALDVARAIAEALVAAHAAGVIHRDLKPANVMLVGGAPEAAKVVDFGIARLSTGGPVLTATGDIVGTPAYMSPEQALSQKDLDGRSDLFSLGCVLYETIAGEYPFAAETPLKILLRLTRERARSLAVAAPATPAKVVALVDAMLAPDPADRPASAAAVHAALTVARSELAPTSPLLASVSTTKPRVAVAIPSGGGGGRLGALSVALLALGLLALVVLAGIAVAVVAPFGSRSPRADARSSRVAMTTSLPAGVQRAEVADRSADPLILARVALQYAASAGGVHAVSIHVRGVTRAGVNLARDGTLALYTREGVRVDLRDGTIAASVWAARSDMDSIDLDAPEGACTFAKAYEAAVSEGLDASRRWTMTLWRPSAAPAAQYVFVDGQGSSSVVAIDAANCRKAVLVLPPAGLD